MSRPLRVAILMSVESPWAADTARALAEAGSEVHVVGIQGLSAGYIAGVVSAVEEAGRALAGVASVSEIRNCRGILAYLSLPMRVCRTLRQVNPDIVLTLYGGVLALLAWISGIRPYAVYAVGSDVLLQTKVRKTVTRMLLSRAAHVFANGQHLAQSVRELAPHARVSPRYLGVRLPDLRSDSTRSACWDVVCTRGFEPIYNNLALVQALPAVLEREGVTVTFTSAGPQLETARAWAQRNLAPELFARVRFLGGVTREVLFECLRRSSVYVSLSRSDGTSTSLLEAMALGVFPVVSDIPANREWISRESGNGFLVSPDSTADLLSGLDWARTNPRRLAAAVNFNRSLVEQRADIKLTSRRLAADLTRIARQR